MSSIVTDQGVVHYEATGRGRPVILLHGWLGSWGYWADTMVRMEGRYRTYALDFWGFGDSGKHRENFHVADFVALVDQFMDRLGIDQATVIGHSMGGTVALSLALTHPQRVSGAAVVGSPIVGSSLSFWLQLAGKPWVASLLWRFPTTLQLFLKLFSLRATKESDMWYQMVTRDVSSTTLDSFFSSIRSLHHTDLRPTIANISVPVMGVYGLKDIIVNPNQAKLLKRYVAASHVVTLPDSGHFPMLDETDKFNQGLLDFLAQSS